MMEKEMETKKEADAVFVGFSGGTLVLTTLVCLLPLILSVAIYGRLPERVVMQWNLAGEPNWYAHKAILAFGLPLLFAAVNVIMNIMIMRDSASKIVAALADPKRENIAKTMRTFTVWSVPVISLIIMPIALLMNMGVELPIGKIVFPLCGAVLIFCGNYLPKSRQNYIVGIRVPWTLKDADNWNKTHRFGGVLFIIGGILFIIAGFLPATNAVATAIALSVVLLIVVVPIVYSYCLHRKDVAMAKKWNKE